MRLGEKALLFFSRKPGTEDYLFCEHSHDPANALSHILKAFPDLIKEISGRDVLDFGCGAGYQVLAMAQGGARRVVGLDSNENILAKARDLAANSNLGKKIELLSRLKEDMRESFDIVISQDSVEHFNDPALALKQMMSVLKKQGRIFMIFGPPWYAPHGSHMNFFTTLPWVNILFSERTIMKVRAAFRNDGAAQFGEVEGGLNKMTVAGFERLIAGSGMRMEYLKYHCIKKLDFLARVPVMRELFIHEVDCILSKR